MISYTLYKISIHYRFFVVEEFYNYYIDYFTFYLFFENYTNTLIDWLFFKVLITNLGYFIFISSITVVAVN